MSDLNNGVSVTGGVTISANGASTAHIAMADTGAGGKTWYFGPEAGTGAAASFGLYDSTGAVQRFNSTATGFDVTGAISATGVLTTVGIKEDASSNVRLGGTPLAWVGASGASGKSMQGDSWVVGSGAGTDVTDYATNSYRDAYNSTWKYRVTAQSATYSQASGRHKWLTAPIGTGGTAVTWTQVLGVDIGQTLALQGAAINTGCGISFPAAQVASADVNTLDDYKEGTWSPTVTANAGSITTLGTVTGTYTKVGRLVTVNMDITITTNGTGGNCLQITNLPYTAAGNRISAGSALEVALTGVGGSCYLYTSTQINIQNYTNGYLGGIGSAANGARIIASLTYHV